jgi:hypothetical protein
MIGFIKCLLQSSYSITISCILSCVYYRVRLAKKFTLLSWRRTNAEIMLTRQRTLGLQYWQHSLTVADWSISHHVMFSAMRQRNSHWPACLILSTEPRLRRSELCFHSPVRFDEVLRHVQVLSVQQKQKYSQIDQDKVVFLVSMTMYSVQLRRLGADFSPRCVWVRPGDLTGGSHLAAYLTTLSVLRLFSRAVTLGNVFLPIINIPPSFHTQVCDNAEQAAHYHIISL